MSVASEITRIQNNIASAYTAVNNKGGTLPATQNSANLATAINSISGGGSSSILVKDENIRFAYSKFTTIPSCLDFTGTTEFNHMFYQCGSLTTISNLDTSSATNLNYLCGSCSNLTSVSFTSTSNVTNFSYVFSSCSKLTSLPQMDTSKGTDFNGFIYYCSKLTTVPQYDFSKATFLGQYFSRSCPLLTTLGGFVNLGQAYLTTRAANYSSYIVGLSDLTALNHDSLMNVINNLYNIATKGCNTQALQLGSTNLAKLSSAEIAIATNKGWTVS